MHDAAPYPRIAMLWSPVRDDRSPSSYARHDLALVGTYALGLEYDREPAGLADGFTATSVAAARKYLAGLRRLNPDIVVLCELYFYEYNDRWLPADHSWWLRSGGDRQRFWPGTHRMDWGNEEYREHVVRQTKALKDAGVDGVFYDNLRNDKTAWLAFLRDVRMAVGDDFLILVNAGYETEDLEWVAPYLNGLMYESGWSHGRTDWDDCIQSMRRSQELLREPRISVIERFEDIRDYAGWPDHPELRRPPQLDPAARRWSLCYALTIGDFYYLFSDNTSHRHDWYPEYDAKIGHPKADGTQVDSHVWRREYEGALVVVNLPGAAGPSRVQTEQQARDVFTGETGTQFTVAPGDGRVLAPTERGGER